MSDFTGMTSFNKMNKIAGNLSLAHVILVTAEIEENMCF